MGLQGTDDPNSFLMFSPTTQHHQKGNHGSYFSASNGCLSNRVIGSEAQASHFTPFRLWSFTLFPELCHLLKQSDSFTISEHSPSGEQEKLLEKLWRKDNFPYHLLQISLHSDPQLTHTIIYIGKYVWYFAGNEMLWILFTLNKTFISHFLYLSFLLKSRN